MKFRGWFSTKEHLTQIQEIRDKTPLYKRMIQRYDIPQDFPYASQLGSQLLSPCISVVSIEVNNSKVEIRSLENQSKGMPTAKPVNFRTNIEKTIEKCNLLSLEKINWKSPIIGWSKRDWLVIETSNEGGFLLTISETAKAERSAQNRRIKERP